ncbi:MAG: sulfite exporter TauE/SafE family protein [Planctomycetota bacterium]
MVFTTADIEAPVWLPPLVALVVSFFTSMGGVSGAFLLLPFQVSVLGYTTPSVSATNHLFNVVAIPSGVYRYVREGRMVWPLTLAVIAGTLPGVFLGAIVRVVWLPDPGPFHLFVAAVLLFIGLRLARDVLRRREGASDRGNAGETSPAKVTTATLAVLEYEFAGETHRVSMPGVFFLSLVVGVVGGIYGIGGGAIMAPFLVSFYRLPVHTVAGAALMGTFVASAAGVAFYTAIAPFFPDATVSPDWLLGTLFGVGGMVGMYAGARCQKYVPARAIKVLLTAIILLTATKCVLDALAK